MTEPQLRTWHGLDGTRARYGLDGDEGWYYNDDNGITANYEGPFKTDDDAREFVRRRAEEGSEFHQRAFMAHIKARLMQ